MAQFNKYPSWSCCNTVQSPLFATCKICQKKNENLNLVNHDWECKDCHMINFLKSKECQSRTCKERRLKSHEQLQSNNAKLGQDIERLNERFDKLTSNFQNEIHQLRTIVNQQASMIANLENQLKKRKRDEPKQPSSPIFGGHKSSYPFGSNQSSSSSNYIKESEMTSVWDHPKYSGKMWDDDRYAYTAENGY